MISAILTAAGSGKRMQTDKNKIFISVNDKPILVHTIEAFIDTEKIDEFIITVADGEEAFVEGLIQSINIKIPYKIIKGGKERQDSIFNALEVVSPQTNIILVHDAARPNIKKDVILKLIEEAKENKAIVVAVKVKDTIKEEANGFVSKTFVRDKLWAIQTPQVFDAKILKTAYLKAKEDGFLGTDDASLVERIGVSVKVVEGDYSNIKITTKEDLDILRELMKNLNDVKYPRVGVGYDVHCLVEGRKLILGGVEVPHTKGLLGHSDADVLLHAIKDALLGAAALGDIGRHFPDSDGRYAGVSSLKLLKEVGKILENKNFKINNIDATIVAQKPKLAPYIEKMNKNIAEVLNLDISQVNVKATTTEKLGFTGTEQGIAAYATVSII